MPSNGSSPSRSSSLSSSWLERATRPASGWGDARPTTPESPPVSNPREIAWWGTVMGSPATKKNSARIVIAHNRRIVIPSKRYMDWEQAALLQIRGVAPRLSVPLSCQANIYRSRLSGDAVNFYQAIGDMLEKAHVVDDDKWIVDWDGTRLLHDKVNPRVEIVLYVV